MAEETRSRFMRLARRVKGNGKEAWYSRFVGRRCGVQSETKGVPGVYGPEARKATRTNNPEAITATHIEASDATEATQLRPQPISTREREQEREIMERPLGTDLFARLPPELWFMIADHLTNFDVANLAYTTRRMMLYLSYSWKSLNKPENKNRRARFLLQFDIHLPQYRLCATCARFRERGRNVGSRCDDCLERHMLLAHNIYLTWGSISEIMRAAAYGSLAYGSPVSALEHAFTSKSWKCEMRGKIADGRLYIGVASSIKFKTDAEGRAFIWSGRNPICDRLRHIPTCTHMALESMMHAERAKLFDLISTVLGQPVTMTCVKEPCWVKPRFNAYGSPIYSPIIHCGKCSSSYRVSIKRVKCKARQGEKSQDTLALRSYRWIDAGAIEMARSMQIVTGDTDLDYVDPALGKTYRIGDRYRIVLDEADSSSTIRGLSPRDGANIRGFFAKLINLRQNNAATLEIRPCRALENFAKGLRMTAIELWP